MKKIAFAGGGTGGHITPLISIYNKLKEEKEIDFFWLGEADSLEEKIAKENGIRFYPIKAGKLRRYFSLKTFGEPLNIYAGIHESKIILSKEKPDLIFSKGGYVSLPVAIASKMLKIPLYLHESDTIPGLANRVVGLFARKIYLGFSGAKKYFSKTKSTIVGQILNPVLFEKHEKLDIGNNKTTLLVIAGSQGSTRIFKMILENITKLYDFNIFVILGSLNTYLKPEFDKCKNVRSYEFINQKELRDILEVSDIAITRAGATSLAELEAFNIKQIIIPLKESANNHQYYNAIEYKSKGELMFTEEKIDFIPIKMKDFIGFKKTPSSYTNEGGLKKIVDDILEFINK